MIELIVNSVFVFYFSVVVFVVKFSVLHSVFKLFLLGIAKNLCSVSPKSNKSSSGGSHENHSNNCSRVRQIWVFLPRNVTKWKSKNCGNRLRGGGSHVAPAVPSFTTTIRKMSRKILQPSKLISKNKVVLRLWESHIKYRDATVIPMVGERYRQR